jgi:hypothetical protein
MESYDDLIIDILIFAQYPYIRYQANNMILYFITVT